MGDRKRPTPDARRTTSERERDALVRQSHVPGGRRRDPLEVLHQVEQEGAPEADQGRREPEPEEAERPPHSAGRTHQRGDDPSRDLRPPRASRSSSSTRRPPPSPRTWTPSLPACPTFRRASTSPTRPPPSCPCFWT